MSFCRFYAHHEPLLGDPIPISGFGIIVASLDELSCETGERSRGAQELDLERPGFGSSCGKERLSALIPGSLLVENQSEPSIPTP